MAYITPNSTVRFHQNIPLDNTYDHTLYFSSLSEQETYFSYRNQNNPSQSRVKYQIDNYTYQRHTRDSIRVALPIENIINCSYMSFKNTSFENKWFYAFITNMEYVNNNTTIVYYEIDVMQTYVINDVTFDQCYIERQHTVSDEIGDNTIPENLELGEYYYEDLGILGQPISGYNIIIAATFSGTMATGETHYTFSKNNSDFYNGVFSGVYLNNMGQSVSNFNQFMDDATEANLIDGVVAVFMFPISYTPTPGSSVAGSSDFILTKNYNWSGSSVTPKNNKIYTYPYNMLYITNNQGNSAEYRWEFFNTPYAPSTASFNLSYAFTCNPEVGLAPKYYNSKITGLDSTNYNEMLLLGNYPICAYATDAYKAWLAQNSTKLNIAMLSSGFNALLGVVGGIGSAVSGNVGAGVFTAVQSVSSGITNVSQLLAEKHVASTMPYHAKGEQANSLNIALKNYGFRGYNVRVRDEYAKIIDDYFTRYGYAIHQNAVPELCARTRFTYIKTVDCTINANMPNEYSQKIVSIMNNGITFWNDKQHIGNYEIANEVWPG